MSLGPFRTFTFYAWVEVNIINQPGLLFIFIHICTHHAHLQDNEMCISWEPARFAMLINLLTIQFMHAYHTFQLLSNSQLETIVRPPLIQNYCLFLITWLCKNWCMIFWQLLNCCVWASQSWRCSATLCGLFNKNKGILTPWAPTYYPLYAQLINSH